jgi:hypothetical protein
MARTGGGPDQEGERAQAAQTSSGEHVPFEICDGYKGVSASPASVEGKGGVVFVHSEAVEEKLARTPPLARLRNDA